MTASTGDGSEVEGFPALPPRSRLSPKDGDGLGVPYLVDLALQAGAVWTITVSIHARRLGQQHVLETTEMNRQGMVTRTSSPRSQDRSGAFMIARAVECTIQRCRVRSAQIAGRG